MAVDKNIIKELAKIAKEWKEVEAQEGYSNIEDGHYVAKVVKMLVNKAKSGSGRLQVMTSFKIMEGEFKGKETSKFDGIELGNKEGKGYFKHMCNVLDIDLPDNPKDLPNTLEAFVEECEDLFNIELKTKGEYQNLMVTGPSEFVEDEEEDEEEDDGDSEPDEEEDDEEEDDEDEDEEEEEDNDDDGEEDEDEDEEEEPEPPKRKVKAKIKAKIKEKPVSKTRGKKRK